MLRIGLLLRQGHTHAAPCPLQGPCQGGQRKRAAAIVDLWQAIVPVMCVVLISGTARCLLHSEAGNVDTGGHQ